MTYAFESGYIILSIWAWAILARDDPNNMCQDQASELLELLVDMIILTYMRSLRLLSIILFIIICGPLLLVCYFKNRPVPRENPGDLIKHFTRVSVGELISLRSMNYRHKQSEPAEKSANAEYSLNPRLSTTSSARDSTTTAPENESLLAASTSTSVLET